MAGRRRSEIRYAGLPEVAAGGVGDARRVLFRLMSVYAVVCWLALLPGWLDDGHPAIVVVAVVVTAVAVVLSRARVLPQPVAHALLGGVPLCTAALTAAAGGGVISAAFAFLALFVTVYAAMFFSRRALTVHLTWSVVASGGALTATSVGDPHNGYYVLVLAITLTATGLLLSGLVRTVWHTATHDPVTGLLNESGLRAAILARPADGTVLVCDIDDFSHVNDALGRDNGDVLLRAVAADLSRTWPRAAAARIGADVFAAWLPTTRDAGALARQLVGLHGPYPAGGIDVDVTLTAGLAHTDGSAPAELLRRAAVALAAAKHDARPWHVWTAEDDRTRRDDLALQAELREAITRGELVVHYQPQVDRHHHRIVGAEALVRWQHPRRGLLGPGAFLPGAERTPLIVDITEQVLADATGQAARWRAAGTPIPVSVNVSARSLTDDGLPERIAAHLARAGLPAPLLTIEITETAIVAQPAHARRLLQAVRDLGVRVSIDDFGTGHTSLALLADLPIDEIKLDRRFVAAALSQPSATAIAVTVADLADRLHLHAVAEGVEDEAVSALMDSIGFDAQQGYHHARPQPADTVGELLASSAAAPGRTEGALRAHGPAWPQIGVDAGPAVSW
ncbi:putative bifunctional diguanylate cyclase/phosphodiesterase [Catenuloplanes atrovinosus]|uniref:Diguanylate cyclase (GGDEF)-like protein n=1 Tax=Catenuloplanes atrovinosus TaxID=137266 RepID=A0AAE4CAC4_9ACTN|nr:GGDEF domain-containing phosphodiesterase [Catenuloplanes atrovinosus]MDR7275684.1 diguanylate cyclase (GGDEF)-like protein [Catenuloplanes atrovinosus]